MNTILAFAFLVNLATPQQAVGQVKEHPAPPSYVIEMQVMDVSDLLVDGKSLTEPMVFSAPEKPSFTTSALTTHNKPMVRTLSGMPARIATESGGAGDEYRIIVVKDENQILLSVRRFTWEKEESEESKELQASVTQFISSGDTVIARVGGNRIILVNVEEASD